MDEALGTGVDMGDVYLYVPLFLVLRRIHIDKCRSRNLFPRSLCARRNFRKSRLLPILMPSIYQSVPSEIILHPLAITNLGNSITLEHLTNISMFCYQNRFIPVEKLDRCDRALLSQFRVLLWRL